MKSIIKCYSYSELLGEIKKNQTYAIYDESFIIKSFFSLLKDEKTYEEVLIHRENVNVKVKAISYCCNLATEYKNKTNLVKKHDGVIIGVLRPDGTVSIKDGNHRAAAYIIAGYDEIPVVLIRLQYLAVAYDGTLTGDSLLPIDRGVAIPTGSFATFEDLLLEYRTKNFPDPQEVRGFFVVTESDFHEAVAILKTAPADLNSDPYELLSEAKRLLDRKAVRIVKA